MKDYTLAYNRIELCKRLKKFIEDNKVTKRSIQQATGCISITAYTNLKGLPTSRNCQKLETFMNEWQPAPEKTMKVKASKTEGVALLKSLLVRLETVADRLENLSGEEDKSINEAQRSMPWFTGKKPTNPTL